MRERVWQQHGIVVDDTFWPVLIERMPVIFPNHDVAIDAWIEHVDGVMKARASRFVMVIDALETRNAADAHTRKRMAEWLSNCQPYHSYCLGIVFIVGSTLVRGGLTAINWITRPRPPRSVVGSWPDALTEARVILQGASLELPIGIGHYATKQPAAPVAGTTGGGAK